MFERYDYLATRFAVLSDDAGADLFQLHSRAWTFSRAPDKITSKSSEMVHRTAPPEIRSVDFVVHRLESGNDTFDTASDDNDRVYDQGGRNDIWTRGGDDRVIGGTDKDIVRLGLGNDFANGDAGDDLLLGYHGNDHLVGGNGDDELRGGDDNDDLRGGAGDDILLGEAGTDVLAGYGDNDILDGGDGDDLIRGNGGDDELLGDTGADRLVGGNGFDVLRGGAGDDILFGGQHRDILWGGNDNDWLDGGERADTLIGGFGIDTYVMRTGDLNNDLIKGLFLEDIIRIPNLGTFLGTADFTGSNSGREVRYEIRSDITYVEFDNDGDGVMDEQFMIDGRAHLERVPETNTLQGYLAVENDFDGDGRADFFVYGSDHNTYIVTDVLNEKNVSLVGEGEMVGSGDVNGDLITDLIIEDAQGRSTIYYSGDAANSYTFGGVAVDVEGVGDYDGDGQDEVLASRFVDNDYQYFFYDEDLTTATTVDIDRSNYFQFGDFDNDGATDILARSSASGPYQIYSTAFGTITLEGTDNNLFNALGDFDGDGQSDLVFTIGNTRSDAISYLYKNFDGSGFEVQELEYVIIASGGRATNVVVADIDRDQVDDLFFTQETQHDIVEFHYLTNGLSELFVDDHGGDVSPDYPGYHSRLRMIEVSPGIERIVSITYVSSDIDGPDYTNRTKLHYGDFEGNGEIGFITRVERVVVGDELPTEYYYNNADYDYPEIA